MKHHAIPNKSCCCSLLLVLADNLHAEQRWINFNPSTIHFEVQPVMPPRRDVVIRQPIADRARADPSPISGSFGAAEGINKLLNRMYCAFVHKHDIFTIGDVVSMRVSRISRMSSRR
jgi:hypothetical protein